MATQRPAEIGESLNFDFLTHSERAAIKRIRAVSHLLDEVIRIPGTNIRFGLDPIAGIVPLIGDSAASVLSLYIVFESYRVGLPPKALVKMLTYIGIDITIGSVPLAGSVFDALWKANTWNANLFESHLEQRTARRQ